jgi:hypothetical protein
MEQSYKKPWKDLAYSKKGQISKLEHILVDDLKK